MLPVILKFLASLDEVDLSATPSELALDIFEVVVKADVVTIECVTSSARLSLEAGSVGVISRDKACEGMAEFL